MVKFFCDRCLTEVEGIESLVEFSIDVTERPNRPVWSWRAEVCRNCYEAMREEVASRIASFSSEEGRKRAPLRRVTP